MSSQQSVPRLRQNAQKPLLFLLGVFPLINSASALHLLDDSQIESAGRFVPRAESFIQLVNDVGMNINTLRTKVDQWSQSQGLTAALGIQSEYPELIRSVNNLRSAATSVAGSQVKPQQLADLVNSMAHLLQSMSQKENDFQRVGARSISADDIRQLEQPTIDVMTGVIRAVTGDCTKLQQLAPVANQASQAFAMAGRTYSLQPQQFPVVMTCQTRNRPEVLEESSRKQASVESNTTEYSGNTTKANLNSTESGPEMSTPVTSTWPETGNYGHRISSNNVAIVVAITFGVMALI